MKKVILSLSVLAVTGVFAQKSQRVMKAQDVQLKAPTATNSILPEKNLTVLWSDDFSDPSTWTIDNAGQTGANFGWNINNTSQGWWSTAGTGMSTNGISGGNNAEMSNGNPTATPATQALNVVYTLTTALPIDVATLSGGSSQVSLQFHQFGARFNDLQEFQISTNGTDFVTVGNNLDKEVLSQSGGAAYPNPELKIVNLAPFLGGTANLSTVWIRFRWTTNLPQLATNPNVWVAYGWYIDDVKIVANPGYDASIVSNYWGSEGLNYYQIPTTQVAPIDFSSRIVNSGTMAIPDAKLNVQVQSGANTVFSGSSAGQIVNPIDSATLELATSFTPPSTVANYTLRRNLSLGNQPNGIVLTGTLTDGGSNYMTETNVATTGGTGTGATVNITATPAGVVATGSLTAIGTGYATATGVATTGGTGTGLTLDITTTSTNAVTSIAYNDGASSGMFNDETAAVANGGTGSGLTIDVLTDGNGNFVSVSINNAGSGYSAGDLVTLNQIAGVVAVTITAVDLTESITTTTIANGGTGYNANDVVTISGGDNNATYTVATVSGGVITAATIANPGVGYTAGDVLNIVDGSATFTINTVTNNTPIVDQIPANNAIADLNFSVTNYIYARDNNTFAGSTTNGTDGFEVGNLFDIWQPQTLKGIAVRLLGGNGGTTVGTEVYAKIYGIGSTGMFEFIEESAPLVVSNAQLNTVLTLPLLSPIDLTANTTYLAVVGAFGGGLRVSNAGASETQTSFFLDLADNTWYFTTSTPVVRLNFDPIISVSEQEMNLQSANIYPNPTATDAVVKFNLNNASDVVVNVCDVTGKVMFSNAMSNLSSGTHQFDIQARDWNSGVYFVNLTSNGATVTKKFVRQ
jgi:hypothetical protein